MAAPHRQSPPLLLALVLALVLASSPSATGCTVLFSPSSDRGSPGLTCGPVCAEDALEADAPRCGAADPCVSCLADDFQDGVRGDSWYGFETTTDGRVDADCSLTEESGELRVDLAPAAAASFCGYTAAGSWDVRGDVVSVEVPEVTRPSHRAVTYFRLDIGDADTVAQFLVSADDGDSVLRFEHFRPGDDLGQDAAPPVPYEPSSHRWWRFREAAGELTWETSAQGRCGTWEVQATIDSLPSLGAINPVIGAGAWSTEQTPDGGRAAFVRFNLPPD